VGTKNVTPEIEHLDEPEAAEIALEPVLHALSDPQRLGIVRGLNSEDGPRRCGSFDLGVTKSTMTHHFRVLREAGVISQWREGTAKLTELRREDLDARFPGLLDAVVSAPAGEVPAFAGTTA
jgi:DNA-binding transcriptional ArsR family regulator